MSEAAPFWLTRARPKVDRIACPWLIRRFIDPAAVFPFVPPTAVAERFNATPFDIEGVFQSHRGETCTFDTMIEEFGLTSEPLIRLATTVRGADTARPELTPHRLGSHVLLDAWLWAIAVLSAVAALLGASFWITLPAAGLAYAFAVARQYVAVASVLALAVLVVIGSGIVDWPAEAIASPRAQQQAPQLSNLFFSGLKAGLLTFGGAYTVIPFLRDDAVGHGWMSDAQFLDGLALSGTLPAPLIIFSTFIGHAGGGPHSALELLQPLTLVRCQTRALALVSLSLFHPCGKRLRRAADLGRD